MVSLHLLSVFALWLSTSRAQESFDAGILYGNNIWPVDKDTDVVASAFPDIKYDLISPAFLEPESTSPGWPLGLRGPTNDSVLEQFYESIAERNTWLTYEDATFKSEEGRALTYLHLSNSSSRTKSEAKLRVYLQAAVHGNEPAGDQSIMALIGKMAQNQTWTASLLEVMDIKILTRYNPDGVNYFQRVLASNFDPNRDHIKLSRQQTRDIKRTFMEYNPHISVDMHEFYAPGSGDYQWGADALITGGVVPNLHPDLRSQVLDSFIPAMGKSLESHGLRWEPYVTGNAFLDPGARVVLEEAFTDARSGRNANALTQTISILCEMRGIGLADQHFHRRVATGLIQLESLLENARDRYQHIFATVARARSEFVNGTDEVIITSRQTLTNRTFTMVSRDNGSVVYPEVDFWQSSNPVPTLTRKRPEAYLIPRPWADVAEKLQVLGLEVKVLEEGYVGMVQALNVTSSKLEDTLYEGTVLNTVTTAEFEKPIDLPSGSFLVSTRQQNAALAFAALEPEHVDSFVRFNIIPLKAVDESVGVLTEYPVYRLMA